MFRFGWPRRPDSDSSDTQTVRFDMVSAKIILNKMVILLAICDDICYILFVDNAERTSNQDLFYGDDLVVSVPEILFCGSHFRGAISESLFRGIHFGEVIPESFILWNLFRGSNSGELIPWDLFRMAALLTSIFLARMRILVRICTRSSLTLFLRKVAVS